MPKGEIQVTLLESAELPGFLSIDNAELLKSCSAEGPAYSSPDPMNGVYSRDGKLYLIRGKHAFCCENTPEAREMMAALTGQDVHPEPESAEDALRMILRGCSADKVQEMVRRFGIRTGATGCVTVLICRNRNRLDPCEAIRQVAPMEKGDLLVSYSPDMAVMIKQGDDLTEITEYLLALIDTVEGETGLRLKAGVGEIHPGPEEWGQGFREACDALRTGQEFHLKGQVQVYRNQLLERLLSEIPAEKRQKYRQMIFHEGTRKVLSPETLETVEMFFDSDLNLSDTARQMFIHRNTLTYRLDKIKKETGLDLRRFRDSVIFQMLMAMPETGTNEEKTETSF